MERTMDEHEFVECGGIKSVLKRKKRNRFALYRQLVLATRDIRTIVNARRFPKLALRATPYDKEVDLSDFEEDVDDFDGGVFEMGSESNNSPGELADDDEVDEECGSPDSHLALRAAAACAVAPSLPPFHFSTTSPCCCILCGREYDDDAVDVADMEEEEGVSVD